ncbi:hypothetical protein FRB97_007093 [Tulasnella sp. 331]|nr:hypothetical protein FRB97_007093 [Tulasnella sp. 331]
MSNDPRLPGGHLSPPVQDVENPSTSGSSSSMRVPSILHTVPSTWDLTTGQGNTPANNTANPDLTFGLDEELVSPPHQGIRTPSSTESSPRDVAHALPEIPPRRGGSGSMEAEDQPGASPPRREFATLPLPRRNSSNKSLNAGLPMTESNMSERPDTLASLINTTQAVNFPRGRRWSRTSGGRPSLTRRRSSDPENPGKVVDPGKVPFPKLTPSTSREHGVGTNTPKRVSFDNESLQQGATNSAPADLQASVGLAAERRDVGSGLKRFSTSLERIRQHFRPHSESVLPVHNDPYRAVQQAGSPGPSSRAQSPTRLFDRRRNNAFWPPSRPPQSFTANTGRSSKFSPCDPYDPPHYHGRRSRYMFHNDNGMFNPCMCLSYFSETLVHYVPSLQLTVYYISLSVRQIYRHLLLRLPSLYFTRVWRIIFGAQVSHAELATLIEQRQLGTNFPISVAWVPPVVPPGLARFKDEWEDFIDHLVKEWKTFNVISALLLSAIMTIFQIPGTDQPVTRTAALAALICGLFSIVYGGVYVVRFQSMKPMTKASRWVEAAQATTTGILWNVWVFLSLPVVALAYAVVFFCIAVMSYVWTAGVVNPPNPIRTDLAWIPRTVITLLFAVGLVYFYMVITTFQSYSDPWPTNDHADHQTITEDQHHHGPFGGGGNEDRSRGTQPGRDIETAPNGDSGSIANGGTHDPDRVPESREARQRRLSLKRFGSPDILTKPSLAVKAVSQTMSLPDLVLSDKLQHLSGSAHNGNNVGENPTYHYPSTPPMTTNISGDFISPSLALQRLRQEELNNITYDPHGNQHRSSPNIPHSSLMDDDRNDNNGTAPPMWLDQKHDGGSISPPMYTGGGSLELRTSRRSGKNGSPLKSDMMLSPVADDEGEKEEDGAGVGEEGMELVDLR